MLVDVKQWCQDRTVDLDPNSTYLVEIAAGGAGANGSDTGWGTDGGKWSGEVTTSEGGTALYGVGEGCPVAVDSGGGGGSFIRFPPGCSETAVFVGGGAMAYDQSGPTGGGGGGYNGICPGWSLPRGNGKRDGRGGEDYLDGVYGRGPTNVEQGCCDEHIGGDAKRPSSAGTAGGYYLEKSGTLALNVGGGGLGGRGEGSLRRRGQDGWIKISKVLEIIPPNSIDVPETFKANDVVGVSWSESTGATGYVLERSIDGGDWTQIYSGPSTSYEDKGLVIAEVEDQEDVNTEMFLASTLRYRVSTTYGEAVSGYKESTDVSRYVNLPPSTPERIVYSSTFDARVPLRVVWGQSIDPEGYEVYYELEKSNDGEAWSLVYNGMDTSYIYTDEKVNAVDSLIYRVRARDSEGAASDYVTGIAAHKSLPTAPEFITVPASVVRGMKFSVEWGEATDPNGEIASYLLEREINGEWSHACVGLDFSLDDVVLDNVASIRYRVAAISQLDALGEFKVSSIVEVKDKRAPNAPTQVTVPPRTYNGDAIEVSWDESVDPDGDSVVYELERKVVKVKKTEEIEETEEETEETEETEGVEETENAEETEDVEKIETEETEEIEETEETEETEELETWTKVYEGSEPSCYSVVPYSVSSVVYRVRAKNSVGLYSDWTISDPVLAMTAYANVWYSQVANNQYFVIKCNHLLGTSLRVPISYRDINVEWLLKAINVVYSLIHIKGENLKEPYDYHTQLLAPNLLSSESKQVVDKNLVDDVLKYMVQFKGVCTCDMECYKGPYGVCTATCPNDTCNCNCNCRGACECPCQCQCECEEVRNGNVIVCPCNCEVAKTNCSYPCECNCVCNCACPCPCACDCNCPCVGPTCKTETCDKNNKPVQVPKTECTNETKTCDDKGNKVVETVHYCNSATYVPASYADGKYTPPKYTEAQCGTNNCKDAYNPVGSKNEAGATNTGGVTTTGKTSSEGIVSTTTGGGASSGLYTGISVCVCPTCNIFTYSNTGASTCTSDNCVCSYGGACVGGGGACGGGACNSGGAIRNCLTFCGAPINCDD